MNLSNTSHSDGMSERSTKKCRVCAKDAKIPVSLDVMHKNVPLMMIVQIICPIRVTKNDRLPRDVCVPCYQILVNAYDLRDTSLLADRILRAENATVGPATTPNRRTKLKRNNQEYEAGGSTSNTRNDNDNAGVSSSRTKRAKIKHSESETDEALSDPRPSTSRAAATNERPKFIAIQQPTLSIVNEFIKQEIVEQSEDDNQEQQEESRIEIVDLISDEEDDDQQEEEILFEFGETRMGNWNILIDGFPFNKRYSSGDYSILKCPTRVSILIFY